MPIDRRSFLGTLALAPAVVAGCAGAAASGGGSAPEGPGAEGAPAGAAAAALAAVRGFPLPPGVEPAFVFRAAAARPGER